MKPLRRLVALLLAIFAIAGLASCAPAAKDMSSYTAVIDVRTADEWATGHLEGAVNIDFESGDFSALIDEFDHSANYVLYCRSGNRAGQAIQVMKDAGFTGELVNAGGVSDAASLTGMKVVQ